MLKKSLKAGSIIMLLFSLLFFIGCSNGTTDTEPDTNTPPVVNPPDTDPPVVEPRVTNVIIGPGDMELGRGESYTFTAQVEGVGAFDRTVTWAVLAPLAGEEPILNTDVFPKQGETTKLFLDNGLHVGQEIRLQASAGSISKLVTITVAPEGPRLSWEPVRVKLDPLAQGTAYAYLRGYSYAEKDIRLAVTTLEEGLHYSVSYENGVSGARPIEQTPIITVEGLADPYETIKVTLDTTNVVLQDPTKSGIVRITILPGAFVGKDVGDFNPSRTSLVFEVSDKGGIVNLNTADLTFGHNDAPTLGDGIPAFNVGSPPANVTLKILTWSPLSYQDKFVIGENKTVTGSFEFTTAAGYYFLEAIKDGGISNASSLKNGAPTVENAEVLNGGRTLKFDLVYNVRGLILDKVDVTGKTVELTDATILDTNLGFTDFFDGSSITPAHKNALPPLILDANKYFTASLAWSGDGVVSATDTVPGTFRAAKFPATRYATATITLSPKVGYTFQGTTLDYDDFVDTGKAFENGAPAKATLIAGTEGNLILTIPYPVVEKVILGTDFNKENFKKLIGRPIHGNDVLLNGVISGTDYVEDFSPYTAKVEWPADTGPLLYGKFNIFDLTSTSPIAKVTLIPKEGYKFDNDYTGFSSALSEAVAVDGPAAVDGTAGWGNITSVEPYELRFELNYTSGGTVPILKQITTLEGIGVNEIADFLVSEEDGSTLAIIPASSEITAVTAAVYEGLINVGVNYPVDGIVKARIIITPAVGYTFKSMTGTTSYFTESDANRAKVIDYLEKVYKGSPVVGTNLAPLVTVNSVTGITLLGTGELVIEAAYKTKPHVIINTDVDDKIGDFPETIANTGVQLPVRLATAVQSDYFTTSNIEWKAKVTLSGAPVLLDDSSEFEADNTYTATITVTPRAGYTFVGSDFNAIETQLSGTVWGGSGPTNIEAATPTIKVTGFMVLPNAESEDILADDKITVTITFDVT